jgi:hypothetical protein
MPSSRDNRKLKHDLSAAVEHDNALIEAQHRATVRRNLRERKQAGREAAILRRKEKEGSA